MNRADTGGKQGRGDPENSEDHDFCPSAAVFAQKFTRFFMGLERKFATRAEQWNFLPYQRILAS
jgi:hypothetical protein